VNNSETLWKDGKQLAEQGRVEEAISQFLAAVEMDDDKLLGKDFKASDWYYRSLVEARLGRNASAITSIEKACQSESTNWSFWFHRSGLFPSSLM
jgi:tetratricopeptide (TPR) repeat protein